MTIKIRLLPALGDLEINERGNFRLEGTQGVLDTAEHRQPNAFWVVHDSSTLAGDILWLLENPRVRQTAFEPMEAKFIVSFLRQRRGIRVSVGKQVIDVLDEAALSRALLTFLEHIDTLLIRKIAITEYSQESLEEFAELLERTRAVCWKFTV